MARAPFSFGSPRRVALAGIAALAIVVGFVFNFDPDTRSPEWIAARNIALRLKTDEGAKAIYEESESLMYCYASAEAFLDAVRAKRSGFGDPPSHTSNWIGQPNFRVERDPYEIHVFLRGTHGAWLVVGLTPGLVPDPSTKIHRDVHFVGIATDQSSAENMEPALMRERYTTQWSTFQETAQALLTDEGVTQLIQSNPVLISSAWSSRRFYAALPVIREALRGISLPPTLQEARRSNQPPSIHCFRQNNKVTVSISWPLPHQRVPQFLNMDWVDGNLNSVEIVPPAMP